MAHDRLDRLLLLHHRLLAHLIPQLEPRLQLRAEREQILKLVPGDEEHDRVRASPDGLGGHDVPVEDRNLAKRLLLVDRDNGSTFSMS